VEVYSNRIINGKTEKPISVLSRPSMWAFSPVEEKSPKSLFNQEVIALALDIHHPK
jgi:hypothetical protein